MKDISQQDCSRIAAKLFSRAAQDRVDAMRIEKTCGPMAAVQMNSFAEESEGCYAIFCEAAGITKQDVRKYAEGVVG